MERIQTNDLVSYLVDRYPIKKEGSRNDKVEKISSHTTLREYYGKNPQKRISVVNILLWIIISVLVLFILLMTCKK